MSVTNLTDENFNKFISNKSLPIMVDFYAQWCGPCRALSSFIDRIANECEGKLLLAKCDIETASNAVKQYEIATVPCVIFFRDGEEFDRVIGFNQQKTREIIYSIIGAN